MRPGNYPKASLTSESRTLSTADRSRGAVWEPILKTERFAWDVYISFTTALRLARSAACARFLDASAPRGNERTQVGRRAVHSQTQTDDWRDEDGTSLGTSQIIRTGVIPSPRFRAVNKRGFASSFDQALFTCVERATLAGCLYCCLSRSPVDLFWTLDNSSWSSNIVAIITNQFNTVNDTLIRMEDAMADEQQRNGIVAEFVACAICQGTGLRESVPCHSCGGAGEVEVVRPAIPCPRCNGTGKEEEQVGLGHDLHTCVGVPGSRVALRLSGAR